MITLGSLFSGSGGFELAGVVNDIYPVWASEIEPYPLKVTAARFPSMKQLGDVTKINGAEIEPVDIITFGSPCQDLSIAGKQAGIHDGERSNLFFQAIRIIKEMRNKTNGQYPRFALWENVPGAFSSNKGEDFRAVLEAFANVCGDNISIPRPPKNKWSKRGGMAGDGWSLAWRVYDAQYWGVPQRRKRIYLVADFATEHAPEILFERESVSGDFEESREAREGTAAYAEGSAGRGCLAFKERAGKPGGGKGILPAVERAFTLATNVDQSICYGVICVGSQQGKAEINQAGLCPTVTAAAGMSGNNQPWIVSAFMGGQGAKARGIAYCDDGTTPTIKASPSGGNTVPDICYCIDQQGEKGVAGYTENVSPTLCSDSHGTPHAVSFPTDGCKCLNSWDVQSKHVMAIDGKSEALCAGEKRWGSLPPNVCYAVEGNTIDRASNKNGKGYCEGVCPTLNTQDRHAICFEPGAAARINTENRIGTVCPTLRAVMGDNKPAVCYPDVARSLCARGDSSPCVDRGQNVVCYENKNVVAATVGSFMTSSVRGALTLMARDYKDPQIVCYNARGNGDGKVSPTLTGDHQNRVTDYTAVCVGNGQLHQTDLGDKTGALNCMHDQQAVVYEEQSPRKYIVRRLTPLECCRLQGFPDWWENGVEGSDSARYKMWGNGIALPCAVDVLGRIVKELRNVDENNQM